MSQYWVQVDGAHALLHHTCPLTGAVWVCVPGLATGHASVVPVQLLYVLVTEQDPLVPEYAMLPEQRVTDEFLASALQLPAPVQ